ncbi:MAG: MmgE/PrpD family protein [Bradyrhizobium sp.]|uniref:MmgE/PrpD family protein n=1 Tax=Bradyrhizobium sp. TaxID=376 RepID=UPI001D399D76|nr:MmgE/PrpD family protein [Bradyrhizobium sp.]MBV9563323.1 MmgE/PrpD family protein [Bradyrhizobium sp.]
MLDRRLTDEPRIARRRFLKQAAAAGLVTSVPALPALAQDKAPGSGQPVLAETLARYAAGLKYENIPEDVVRLTKRTILDTVGCAFGGYEAGPSRIAIKLAGDVTAKQPATVLISGVRTSPDLAVFADGVMIRYLDFNDAFVSLTHGAGHPSDTLAALVAAAEVNGGSGRDLITATVLAYEVFCKVADVFDYLGNGIDHSTITGIAAVVGAGRLMGLTPEQMAHAIGITVGGNTATRQGRSDELSNWKAFAAADACRKAIFAIQLAQNGMTGPGKVFEGTYGFFKVMGKKPVEPPQLGEPFGIRRAFTKRFPLGQFSQTVAQAAMEVRSSIGNPDDIQEVSIHVSHSAIKIMADGPDKWKPQTHETADHSIPYAAALVLMYGKIEPEYYEDPYLHDARLLDLVSRIKVLPSDEADRTEREFNLCEMEVVPKQGPHKTVRVEYHRGHFKNPMTDAEMEEKFRLMARKHLPADRVEALLRILWGLQNEPQVSRLIAATVV